MYEHHKMPLASTKKFARRLLLNSLLVFFLLLFSLWLGMLGYHGLENLSWVDSILNASMILSGMGPVSVLQTDAGKIFASCYALYSGAIFLICTGVIAAPVLHRVMHYFHLAEDK